MQVNLPPEGRDDPAAWPEVVNKIKESIVLAFDTAVVEREEEVKRGEAQRMMVGWNFCTWFLLKVRLGHISTSPTPCCRLEASLMTAGIPRPVVRGGWSPV